jgi:hypothetical protein
MYKITDKQKNDPGFQRQRKISMKEQVVDRIISSQKERIVSMTKAGKFEGADRRQKYNEQLNKLAKSMAKKENLKFERWSKPKS